MSDLDELGELDALHKDRTGRGIEFSAEEARLLDELLASADIGSPIPPPVRAPIDIIGTETSSPFIGTETDSQYIADEPRSPHLSIELTENEAHIAEAPLDDTADTAMLAAPPLPVYGPPSPTVSSWDTPTSPEKNGPVAVPVVRRRDWVGEAGGSSQTEDIEHGAESATSLAPDSYFLGEAGLEAETDVGELDEVETEPLGNEQPSITALVAAPLYGEAVATATNAEESAAVETISEPESSLEVWTAPKATDEEARLNEAPVSVKLESDVLAGPSADAGTDETADTAVVETAEEALPENLEDLWHLPAIVTPAAHDEAAPPTEDSSYTKTETEDIEATAEGDTSLDAQGAAEFGDGEAEHSEDVSTSSEIETVEAAETETDEDSDIETVEAAETGGPEPLLEEHEAEEPPEPANTGSPASLSASLLSGKTETAKPPTIAEQVSRAPEPAYRPWAGAASYPPRKIDSPEEPAASVPSRTATVADAQESAEKTVPLQPAAQAAIGPRSQPAATSQAPATQAVGAFSLSEPMTYAGSRPRRRARSVLVTVLVVVVFAAALGAGFMAYKQNKSTTQWRQRANSAVILNRGLTIRDSVLSKQLLSDHAAVASLDTRTTNLTRQVTSLQAQLSAISKAKAATLAKSEFGRLQSEAGTVTSALSTCAGDTSSLTAEVSNDLTHPSYKDPHLQPNTQAAEGACSTARQDSLQLQSTLRGAQ